ncbi:ATP-grasp domain-containing protein [Bacillus sp. AGMB 02131]|uniref:biotin carboxylase n=1 Tax=Peribacillus faecalis TaxID=2772559 RepID=A0A927CXK4_9BACI|nr:biotin carboxylase N-terminal domain-containing protein [Peribacillus faecalis]MBD3108911.1 ATP-grasp domain-containing protein [Peribacillus faecalis]
MIKNDGENLIFSTIDHLGRTHKTKVGGSVFRRVLIANRGAIAARILKTLKDMEIEAAIIYSTADRDLPYIKEASVAYEIYGNFPRDTYLNQQRILEIIKESGSDAVHPGYGFLAENTEFARKVEKLGVTFIGPNSKWIDLMADKNRARQTMSKYTMPIGKGSSNLPDNDEEILAIADEIGYPVLIKPCNGGGGIGMQPVYNAENLIANVRKAKTAAEKYFSDNSVYLESYLENPRHIEIQIIADRHGNVVHLYERDCSIQRRHQKIIEESPAPNISREELNPILKQVTESIQSLGYDNIGTVELLRSESGQYSFLEMNTRLQVEHAVTEEVVNTDLIKAQIRSAYGETLQNILPEKLQQKGHSIEVRIYAEDPQTFYPSPGTLEKFRLPEAKNIRIETGFTEGNKISPFYDPMIAKIIVHTDSRDTAIEELVNYLQIVEITGLKTNIPFLIYALKSEEFKKGKVSTKLAEILVKRMKEEMKK